MFYNYPIKPYITNDIPFMRLRILRTFLSLIIFFSSELRGVCGDLGEFIIAKNATIDDIIK